MTCIEWQGAKNAAGYGVKMTSRKLGLPRKQLLRHRLVYEAKHGKIPHGMMVRHTCDNRACINVDHLIVGTHQDNMQDKVDRNRQHRPRGELNGRAALSSEDVQRIRLLVGTGQFPYELRKKLADAYGVTGQTIYHAAKGKTWREAAE